MLAMRIGLQAWGSEGDIQPFTALAAGLVKSGHTVTLVVTDNIGRDYRDLAKRFGYSLVPVPNPQIPSAEEANKVWRQIIELGNPIKQAELVLKHGFDPVADAMYAAAKKLCEENDVVVGHFFVYPLRVAAEKAGVPMATVNIVHNCIPSSRIRPPGIPDIGRWFQLNCRQPANLRGTTGLGLAALRLRLPQSTSRSGDGRRAGRFGRLSLSGQSARLHDVREHAHQQHGLSFRGSADLGRGGTPGWLSRNPPTALGRFFRSFREPEHLSGKTISVQEGVSTV